MDGKGLTVGDSVKYVVIEERKKHFAPSNKKLRPVLGRHIQNSFNRVIQGGKQNFRPNMLKTNKFRIFIRNFEIFMVI